MMDRKSWGFIWHHCLWPLSREGWLRTREPDAQGGGRSTHPPPPTFQKVPIYTPRFLPAALIQVLDSNPLAYIWFPFPGGRSMHFSNNSGATDWGQWLSERHNNYGGWNNNNYEGGQPQPPPPSMLKSDGRELAPPPVPCSTASARAVSSGVGDSMVRE